MVHYPARCHDDHDEGKPGDRDRDPSHLDCKPEEAGHRDDKRERGNFLPIRFTGLIGGMGMDKGMYRPSGGEIT
jgi:hypothetical protein